MGCQRLGPLNTFYALILSVVTYGPCNLLFSQFSMRIPVDFVVGEVWHWTSILKLGNAIPNVFYGHLLSSLDA
jgi:hypothetical protein